MCAVICLALALFLGAAPAGAFTPNDPLNYLQWHFGDIGMGSAWDISGGGSSEVRVAVIDSGIANGLSDFSGTNFDLSWAHDYVTGGSSAYDTDGHGSHVAGTIAQTTNNNTGVAGVAFNSTLIPMRVLDDDGYGTWDWAAAAIDRAIAAGADVINMSFSGGYSSVMQEAVQRAYDAGVFMVAAAGNSGGGIEYPAAYSQVLAVGATTMGFGLASYSSRGSDMVVAPGGDYADRDGNGYVDGVLQQYVDGDYWFYAGTSMASPHAAGLAALLISRAKNLGVLPDKNSGRVDWLRWLMTSTTLDLGSGGQDGTYGYGQIRAENALNALNALAGAGDAAQQWQAAYQTYAPSDEGYDSGEPLSSSLYYAIPLDDQDPLALP